MKRNEKARTTKSLGEKIAKSMENAFVGGSFRNWDASSGKLTSVVNLLQTTESSSRWSGKRERLFSNEFEALFSS